MSFAGYTDTGSSGSGGGLSGLLGSNPNLLGAGVAAGGLGALLLGGGTSVPYSGSLSSVAGAAGNEASQLYNTGNTLINPEINGQLPAGANAQVQQFIQNETAAVKSRYASLGLTGSTMETDALNNIQTNSAALSFQIEQQMAQQGIQLTGQSLQGLNIEGGIYESLMQAQMKQNQQLYSAIGSFAGALAKAAPALAA